VQTFLPYPDFSRSIDALDKRRCWKQALEARQIIGILEKGQPGKGWEHHRCTKMWRGYHMALKQYFNIALKSSLDRGIRVKAFGFMEEDGRSPVMPPWFGWPPFHESHQSNLLRKKPEWYAAFGWQEKPEQPYLWPVDYKGQLLPEVKEWLFSS
jgi:hypothetical protein